MNSWASIRRIRVRGRGGIGVIAPACAAIIVLATLTAVLAPLLAPYDPEEADLSYAFVGPTGGHLLGFDGQGRDILSRLLFGARLSLLGPLAVVVVVICASTTLALVAAWRGGWVDSVISSSVNVMFAFPGIILAILATAAFGVGLPAAIIALAIAYTPSVSRVLRGTAAQTRGQEFITALEIQGLSSVRIGLRHLLPSLRELIVVEVTLLFGYAMVDLAAISYLGLGVQPPQPDWGIMVADGQAGILQGYPAEALAAGACIFVVVLAFTLLGEKLSERTTGRRGVPALLLRRHPVLADAPTASAERA